MINFNRSREIFLKIYPSERLANKIEYYIGRHESKVKFFLLFCDKNRWEVTLKQRVRRGEYQLALCDISFTGNTAYSVLSRFTSMSKENFTFFKDKKYDAAVQKIKTGDGIAATSVNIKAAEDYLISSCALVPIKRTNNYYAMGKKVSGVTFNISGEILYFKKAVQK